MDSTDVIPLGPNQTLRVLASSPEALELESTWEPGSTEPPPHLHPGQDERFEVLEGELTVVVDGDRRVLERGATLESPGHRPRDVERGGATARASWRVTPALRTEEMLRTIASGGAEDFLERFAAEFRLAL